MFTPDWNDAPEWANYVAMDDDGEWYWYENEPTFSFGTWHSYYGRNQPIETTYCEDTLHCEDSLQSRPKI